MVKDSFTILCFNILKAMGHELSNLFITSLVELKLDVTTMFEWHRHTQDHTNVPDCHVLYLMRL